MTTDQPQLLVSGRRAAQAWIRMHLLGGCFYTLGVSISLCEATHKKWRKTNKITANKVLSSNDVAKNNCLGNSVYTVYIVCPMNNNKRCVKWWSCTALSIPYHTFIWWCMLPRLDSLIFTSRSMQSAVMPQNVVCPSVSPSVCPSVFMYHDLIGWNTLKIISRLMR